MNDVTYLNFLFPTFGLRVCHNTTEVINAKFYNPALDLYAPIDGEPNGLTAEIERQLNQYIADPLFQFNLPFELNGTEHQLKIWHIMQTIPVGSVLTYGDVAKEIKSAPRAVGGACGKNPLPVIIPCHRIIAANNGLGGFNSGNIFFGLNIKKWLLEHEGILPVA